MYTVNLKKAMKSETTFQIMLFAYFKIDKAQRQQYSTFDVGRSMFDVQSVRCSGRAEFHTKFHTSGAAGLKSGQFNHQETVPFWCSFIQDFGCQEGESLNPEN
jgi:hypothetical protein